MKRVEPDADFDVQLTLERARVAREPSLADKQRVLEALQVRIGDLPSLPAAGESTTGVRMVVPKLKYASIAERAAHFARSLVTSKAAAAHLIWVGAATGGLGFWLGARENDAVPAADQAARTGAMVAPAGSGVPPAVVRATAAAPPRPSALTPEHAAPSVAAPPVAPSSTPAVAPAKPIPAPPPAPAAEPRVQRRSAAARGSDAARVSEPPAVDPNARFLEAVRLLARAQRALDGDEPALALALLDELDQRVPRELLSEEREAALVVALCKSGDVDRARRALARLAAHSPSSIYAARIARSCGSFGDAASGPNPARPANARDARKPE
jgi:hypothetical protein